MRDKIAKKILKMKKDKLMLKPETDRDWEMITALDIAIDSLDTDIRPQSKWIPVSEKLPNESNGSVLITMREGKVTTGKHSEYSGNWYIGDMAKLANQSPVAWMPLPEPYKEEAEK